MMAATMFKPTPARPNYTLTQECAPEADLSQSGRRGTNNLPCSRLEIRRIRMSSTAAGIGKKCPHGSHGKEEGTLITTRANFTMGTITCAHAMLNKRAGV